MAAQPEEASRVNRGETISLEVAASIESSMVSSGSDPAGMGGPAKTLFLSEALGYARRGWHIFPLKPGTNDEPLVKWGLAATTDPAAIRDWWSKWPTANIGLACAKSGLCVLDLDMKKGKNGRVELDQLELEHGRLPPTLTASTPTGGAHLYFCGTAATTAGKIGRGIDTRASGGNGGYVLLPPSRRNEGRYAWKDKGRSIAPLPTWLGNLIGEPRERKERNEEPTIDLDGAEAIAWAKRYLERDAEPAFEGQNGNNTSYQVTCVLRDKGLSEAVALDLMLEHYNERCEPPWPPGDLEKIVANVFEYGQNRPGSDSAAADFKDEPAPDIKPPSTRRWPRFQCHSYSELKSLKSPRWLVNRLIPDGGLAVVYGQPKVGKTFWALELSLCVATGRPFHGLTVRQGCVTYVAAEGGPARLRDRVAAWLKARGVEERELENQWELIAAPVDLPNPKVVSELIDALGGRRHLVVFDTLARCMSGDENSQKDMGASVAGCDRIRTEIGASVLLVHHEGKDGARGARGSTVLRGAIDTSIRGSADKQGPISFTVEDQRDDEPLAAMKFELSGVRLEAANEWSAVLQPLSSASDDFDTPLVRGIAVNMGGNAKNLLIKAVADHLKVSPETARRRVDVAIPKGCDKAVEHDGWMIWLEPHPTNPRGVVLVRVERAEG